MEELVERALTWVAEVHPHERHLRRTLDWLLELDPRADVALQVAAVTHDIERAFPGDEVPPSFDDPASTTYNTWHQDRCARIVEPWLRDQGVSETISERVTSLVRVHEEGGWPAADLLQAADSLSFLEVQSELFAGLVSRREISLQTAERKLQFMYERVRLPRARELAAPMLAAGLVRIGAAARADHAASEAGRETRLVTGRKADPRSASRDPRKESRMGILDGKVAIVTGAGTGLGRSHALSLAAAGAAVLVNNRISDPRAGSSAQEVASEITTAGGHAIVDTASVADWRAMGALVERAVDELGRLDIVINNAGILAWKPVAEIDEEQFDDLMNINFKGTFALTRHACAHWIAVARRGEHVAGRIINTTSGVGLFGFPRGGLYGASKGATVSLTMVCAMEMRRHGVTANLIWPEARTRMGKGIFPEAPEGEGVFDPYDPANISPLVVYLASDAAAWLTGQILYVQGNRVRRMSSWSTAGEYRSAQGRSLDVAELADAVPLLYNTLPTLQPETSLQDAISGIDPATTGAAS